MDQGLMSIQALLSPLTSSGVFVRLYHGDLCARNILLTFEDDVILADFGIGAKHNRHHGAPREYLAVFKNRSITMAPEMRDRTVQTLDARADL